MQLGAISNIAIIKGRIKSVFLRHLPFVHFHHVGKQYEVEATNKPINYWINRREIRCR